MAEGFRRSRRRIVWTEQAQRLALEAAERYERLYDVIKGLEWLLERQPDNAFAQPLGDGEHWLIKSEDLYLPRRTGVPEVLLIYRFDEETVTFWDLRITPPRGSHLG